MSGTGRSCLLVAYGYALDDPPSRQAAASIAHVGWKVTILQTPPTGVRQSTPPPGVQIHEARGPGVSQSLGAVYRLAKWRSFRRDLKLWIDRNKPELVVTIMLHSLAALPENHAEKKTYKLVSCVYDIPSMIDAGRLDRRILLKGWSRLRNAEVVWSSDIHKAELAREFGKLNSTPLVCHNTPPEDYLPEPTWPRDSWLRNELHKLGASIGEKDGCILLRAGAVGERGGIEETLEAMRNLPTDFVFLMMGRPEEAYEKQLLRTIDRLGLTGRAFLWRRPTDETWKKALRGADIGHLIHGPFPSGAPSRLYALNSSLSNNRLFQYMAAGLPIVSYDDPRMRAIHDEISCFRIVRVSNLQSDIQRVLMELAADQNLRQALGSAGRQAHLSKYNWENQFEKVSIALQAPNQNGL